MVKTIVRRLVFLSGMLVSFPAFAGDIGWRYDGSGIFKGATPPVEWSNTKNIAWRTDVGQSYSSPVAIGDRVLVTSEPNDLICINVADGKIAWKKEVSASILPAALQPKVKNYFGPNTSGNAAITPASDGQRVYAVFGNGIIACCDIKSGDLKWARFINKQPSFKEGRTASPLLVGGNLIVHLTSLFALDPATGQTRWTQDNASDAYGSPVAARIGKEDVIATPAGDIVRVSDGKILASNLGTAQFSSPVVSAGVYYLDDASCVAVQLPAEIAADKADTKQIWSDSVDGAAYSSPVVMDRFFYVVSDSGILTIFDIKAKTKVEKQLDLVPLDSKANVHPSIAVAGKYLFLGNDQGRTIVIESGKDAKVISVNNLAEGSAGSMALSGGRVFLRGGSNLYCIVEKNGT